MRRTLSVAAGLLGLLLLPTTTWASRDMVNKLKTRIDLKVEKADPQEVLQTFGKLMSLAVEVDPSIDKPLSLHLENVTVQTALSATCESVGCKWYIQQEKLLKVIPDDAADSAMPKSTDLLKTPIVIELTDVEAYAAFSSLANAVGEGLSMDPAITGKVTLNMRDRSIAEILDVACAQVHCRWRLTGGSKSVLEIKPR
jgi:type II secretory pathway component GspD/PulD (secretin)